MGVGVLGLQSVALVMEEMAAEDAEAGRRAGEAAAVQSNRGNDSNSNRNNHSSNANSNSSNPSPNPNPNPSRNPNSNAQLNASEQPESMRELRAMIAVQERLERDRARLESARAAALADAEGVPDGELPQVVLLQDRVGRESERECVSDGIQPLST